jgi:hypothetical protein
MEATLLMFDVIGVTLVLLWAARGKGGSGLFAWRDDPVAKPEPVEPLGARRAPRRR